jgi:hypothetical protein
VLGLTGAWSGGGRRHYYGKKEGDVEVPDMVMTGLVWGLFMGVSSNLRYQVWPPLVGFGLG